MDNKSNNSEKVNETDETDENTEDENPKSKKSSSTGLIVACVIAIIVICLIIYMYFMKYVPLQDELKKAMTDLETQSNLVLAMNAKISDNIKTLDDLKKQILDTNDVINNTAQIKTEKNGTIASLESKLEETKSNYNIINKQLTEAKTSYKVMSDAVIDTSTAIANIQSNITRLNLSITEYTNKILDISRQKTADQKTMTNLSAQIDTLNSEISVLNLQTPALQTQYDSLITQKNELAEKNTSLRQQSLELEQKIAELKENKTSLDNEIAQLQNKALLATTNKTNVEAEYSKNLMSYASNLEIIKTTMTSGNVDLATKITQLFKYRQAACMLNYSNLSDQTQNATCLANKKIDNMITLLDESLDVLIQGIIAYYSAAVIYDFTSQAGAETYFSKYTPWKQHVNASGNINDVNYNLTTPMYIITGLRKLSAGLSIIMKKTDKEFDKYMSQFKPKEYCKYVLDNKNIWKANIKVAAISATQKLLGGIISGDTTYSITRDLTNTSRNVYNNSLYQLLETTTFQDPSSNRTASDISNTFIKGFIGMIQNFMLMSIDSCESLNAGGNPAFMSSVLSNMQQMFKRFRNSFVISFLTNYVDRSLYLDQFRDKIARPLVMWLQADDVIVSLYKNGALFNYRQFAYAATMEPLTVEKVAAVTVNTADSPSGDFASRGYYPGSLPFITQNVQYGDVFEVQVHNNDGIGNLAARWIYNGVTRYTNDRDDNGVEIVRYSQNGTFGTYAPEVGIWSNAYSQISDNEPNNFRFHTYKMDWLYDTMSGAKRIWAKNMAGGGSKIIFHIVIC